MASYDDTAVVSGSVVSFADGADEVPCKSVKVTIPASLSGVSSVSETQTGRNLFDKSTVTANTWIVVNDTTTESTVGYRTSGYIPVKANTKYFVTAKSSNRSAYYDRNKNGIAYFSFAGGASFNCLYDGYIRITIKDDIDLNTFIVNEGNEAIAYEPFGTTYTASLGRTIYGGQADIVNGIAEPTNYLDTANAETNTNNSVSITCDGKGKYTATGTATGGSANITFTLKTPCEIKSGDYFHCGNSVANGSVSITLQKQDNTSILYFALSPINRIVDLSSYAGQTIYSIRFYVANGASFEMTLTPMLCYNSAVTPYSPYFTPFTFTGQEVPTRLGYNAFWSEQGNTELTYYKSGYGFTSVTVNKTGKNLFDISKVATTGTTAGISWSVSGNEITISGTASSSGWKTFVEFKLPHKGTYHFHMNATGNVGYFLRGRTQLVGKDVTEVCNDPSQVYRIAIAVTTAGQTYEGTISEIQIEVGDAYTSYEPYEAISKTAKFHRIVYGGTADVVRGTCEPKNLISPPEYTANTPSLCLDLGEDRTFDSVTLSFLATNTVVNANNASIVDYRKNDGTHQYRTLARFKNENGVDFAKQTSNSGRFRNSYISVSGITFRYVYIYYEYNSFSYISTDSMSEWQLELGSTASEYVPHFEPFTFTPISMETDEGENTLFANEGASAITYRKDTE